MCTYACSIFFNQGENLGQENKCACWAHQALQMPRWLFEVRNNRNSYPFMAWYKLMYTLCFLIIWWGALLKRGINDNLAWNSIFSDTYYRLADWLSFIQHVYNQPFDESLVWNATMTQSSCGKSWFLKGWFACNLFLNCHLISGSRETRLSSREKQDATSNLLLRGTVSFQKLYSLRHCR